MSGVGEGGEKDLGRGVLGGDASTSFLNELTFLRELQDTGKS